MLGVIEKSTRDHKSCVDSMAEHRQARGMDEFDPIREVVVEAMTELEQALVDGLPAQAPRSSREDIAGGLIAIRARAEAALVKIERAQALLLDVS
jgi:hypothetical protein